MLTGWTSEDIASILEQLNQRELPFKHYAFQIQNGVPVLLGRGATANVYRAYRKEKPKDTFAIKVIGFGDKRVESEDFRKAVGAQKKLASSQDSIVRIYKSVELYVWITGSHTVSQVKILEENTKSQKMEGDFLHLQFVLMEEVEPVVWTNRVGKPFLCVPRLATHDTREILKLASDIGLALRKAHEERMIHRDVKLENIFYDRRSGHYKLGDFGIACTTNDGFASTVAFTKGYGAPEVVGTLEDRYDATADIYSFGMVLYVLLNELRFPGSPDYHPNIMQYAKGFQAEEPIHGDYSIKRLVLKMIQSNPDQRIQTMEEVLKEIDYQKYGKRVRYLREHKNAPLVMGIPLAILGVVIAQLTYNLNWASNPTKGMYLFWILCVWKGLNKFRKREYDLTEFGILIVGLWLMISTGFAWWKLLGIIYLSWMGTYSTGFVGVCFFLMKGTGWLQSMIGMRPQPDYKWVANLLISIVFHLLLYYDVLDDYDEKTIKLNIGRNLYWPTAMIIYAGITLIDYLRIVELPLQLGVPFGSLGMVFCILWMIRENYLIYRYMPKRL